MSINMDDVERKEEVIISLIDSEEILAAIYNYFGSANWADFVKWYYENEL